MAPHAEATGERTVVRSMRLLMMAAAVLVALAGIQLFVFSEQTDRFFAWTIDPPITAGFLGAAYWASVAMEVSAARQRAWADARIAVPTVFTFTVLTLIVTIVHLDRFHLGEEFGLATRAVTWAWIAVYTVVPILMIVIAWVQMRAPGSDPPRSRPIGRPVRLLSGVQAAAFTGVGVTLLIAPASGAGLWPWELTPLTGRAIGAWLVSFGLAGFHVLIENDLRRVRPAGIAYLALGILQIVVLARFSSDFDWSSPQAVGYLVFLATILAAGGAALRSGASPPQTH
ncbi:hypothetical protein BH23ACT5_BH23ACT5_19350 [soil metagenome]